MRFHVPIAFGPSRETVTQYGTPRIHSRYSGVVVPGQRTIYCDRKNYFLVPRFDSDNRVDVDSDRAADSDNRSRVVS